MNGQVNLGDVVARALPFVLALLFLLGLTLMVRGLLMIVNDLAVDNALLTTERDAYADMLHSMKKGGAEAPPSVHAND